MAPGQSPAGPQALDGALEHHLAAGSAGAGTEVDNVIGDGDQFRFVLDDQDGVALVPQPQQQAFIRWMSWGCSPTVGSSKT